MKPTKRAERLGDYLANELGWEVSDEKRTCTKCGGLDFNRYHKHCTNCGKKLPDLAEDQKHLFELEEAIKFALKESND